MNVMDVETFNDNNYVRIYCISYIYNNKLISIYIEKSNDELFTLFLNNLLYENDNIFVFYIHNINFDGILIMDYIFKNKIKFDWIIHDNNIYSITIHYLHITVIFKCSYKFLPVSLKNLGEILNFEKKIFPYSFVNINNLFYIGDCPPKYYFNDDVDDNSYLLFKSLNKIFDLKKVTIEYCENDVKLTQIILINILNILKNMNPYYEKIFNNCYSSPSLSYNIYFKYWNFFKINKKILKENEYYIKKSYFGGRCEVFGNSYEFEIIHYFDFSGMYEQCMNQKFPYGKSYFKTQNLNYNNIGFHCIKYYSNMEFPILPQHSEDNKLIFPNGELYGCYWYEEIKLFVENGGIVLDIISSYEFEKEDFIFKEFVNEFSKIKKISKFHKMFGKLIINSLYGGFAMSEKDHESIICYSDIEYNKILETLDVIEIIKKNNCYILKIIKNNKSDKLFKKNKIRIDFKNSIRNITYASCISSKGRIKLYKAFLDVIKSGGRLLYCDTDSIAASYKKNMIGIEIGEIKWSEIWKDAVFINPKFYCYIDNDGKEYIKNKGISSKDYSFNEIKNSFYKNKENLEYKNQLNFNKKKFILNQNYINKVIKINNYEKRIFTKDKKKTKPIIYPLYDERK